MAAAARRLAARAGGPLRLFTLLLLLATAAVALPADWDAMDPAQAAEWNEWAPFFDMLERAAAAAEGNAQALAELGREPETDWLKACAGWTAQEMCSTVFGSGIDEETARREDCAGVGLAADYWMNYTEKSVTASCKINNPNNSTYKSIFREGIGCTLVEGVTEEELRAQDIGDQTPPPPLDPSVPWPEGEGFFPENNPPEVDLPCLQNVARVEFENERTNPRAILVVYKGQLVYEEYAPGITKDNRLLGWSATKTLTAALLSLLVGEGRVDIDAPAPIPWWNEVPDDPRQNITMDMMLRMSSGTEWNGTPPPARAGPAPCAEVAR